MLTTKQAIDASGLVVEEPTSDAATALWKWVLADPEAKKWLDGTPDEWGMKVNPIYSTIAANNSNGAPFGNPAPHSFPKSDPYCYDSGQTAVGSPAQTARPICVLDWSPYTLTMQAAARAAGSANSGAKTTLDPTATRGDRVGRERAAARGHALHPLGHRLALGRAVRIADRRPEPRRRRRRDPRVHHARRRRRCSRP